MDNRSDQLKTEHVIHDASKWLRENKCVIKLPDQVYYGRKHAGTLNVVDNKLVFIPSITYAEWERVSRLPASPADSIIDLLQGKDHGR